MKRRYRTLLSIQVQVVNINKLLLKDLNLH